MKILVTGGAGFFGSNLVDVLIEQGHEVAVVDNLLTGKKEHVNPAAHFFELDVRDKKLSQVLAQEKPEAVFHLAAQIDLRKSVEDPLWDAEENILGSINLLKLCQDFGGVKKIIFSSSGGAIYGDTNDIPTKESHQENPVSPYGIAKLTIDKYLHYYHQVFGLPYISLRYSNIYGPRQNAKGEAGVVAIFCDRLLSGQSVVINGNGSQTRDYVYVTDVVQANLLALDSAKVAVYNIGTGIETNVNQIADLIKKNINPEAEFSHGPAKAGEQQRSCLDANKAKVELGWQPAVDLAVGIQKTVEWFKNNHQ